MYLACIFVRVASLKPFGALNESGEAPCGYFKQKRWNQFKIFVDVHPEEVFNQMNPPP